MKKKMWRYAKCYFKIRFLKLAPFSLRVIRTDKARLRWYGTPCNIFKDDMIIKKMITTTVLNIYNMCPQNAFIKFQKRGKK